MPAGRILCGSVLAVWSPAALFFAGNPYPSVGHDRVAHTSRSSESVPSEKVSFRRIAYTDLTSERQPWWFGFCNILAKGVNGRFKAWNAAVIALCYRIRKGQCETGCSL